LLMGLLCFAASQPSRDCMRVGATYKIYKFILHLLHPNQKLPRSIGGTSFCVLLVF
jgi:hypothetical protein